MCSVDTLTCFFTPPQNYLQFHNLKKIPEWLKQYMPLQKIVWQIPYAIIQMKLIPDISERVAEPFYIPLSH